MSTTVEEELCTHHFLIAPHDSPTSLGICQKCGEERFHSNELIRSYNATLKPRVVNKTDE